MYYKISKNTFSLKFGVIFISFGTAILSYHVLKHQVKHYIPSYSMIDYIELSSRLWGIQIYICDICDELGHGTLQELDNGEAIYWSNQDKLNYYELTESKKQLLSQTQIIKINPSYSKILELVSKNKRNGDIQIPKIIKWKNNLIYLSQHVNTRYNSINETIAYHFDSFIFENSQNIFYVWSIPAISRQAQDLTYIVLTYTYYPYHVFQQDIDSVISVLDNIANIYKKYQIHTITIPNDVYSTQLLDTKQKLLQILKFLKQLKI